MDLESIGSGGGAAGVVAGLITYFKARENRLAKKLDMERDSQRAVLDRIAALELREAVKDKKIETLTALLADVKQENAVLKWRCDDVSKDLEDLRRAHDVACKQLSMLNDKLVNMYSGKDLIRPLGRVKT